MKEGNLPGKDSLLKRERKSLKKYENDFVIIKVVGLLEEGMHG